MEMLKQFDLNLSVNYSMKTRKMTGSLNGNRFICVNALPEGKFLPVNANAQGCSVSFSTTVNFRITAHYFKISGHSLDEDTWDHYTVPLTKVVPFAGASDVQNGDIPIVNAIQSASTALDAK